MSAHLQDEQLTAALDGTLSGADREAVDAHLQTCARCRGELELAREARGALRSLPEEIRPPIDVAAAVMSEISGAGREDRRPPGTPSEMPRWYRAAGLVAAAAAIALAVLIVPRVVGNDVQNRTTSAAAEAGGSGTQESGLAPVAAGTPVAIENEPTDYDAASLPGLLDDTESGVFGSAASPPAATDTTLQQRDAKAIDCVRTAAGDAIPAGARLVRLIDATYEGAPATLGVYSLPDGRAGVWVSARDDCRLLASAITTG